MTATDCWRPSRDLSWETLDESETPLVWSCDGDGVVQGPLELSSFSQRTLVLNLAPGQVALLALHGDLRAILLDGQHTLTVNEHDDGVPSDARLVFLAIDRPWRVSWGEDESTSGASTARRGTCTLRIANPALFYASFLRHAEAVGEPFLRKLIGTLCQSQLEKPAGAGAHQASIDLRAYGLACELIDSGDRDQDASHAAAPGARRPTEPVPA